jgi:hypothetical protein
MYSLAWTSLFAFWLDLESRAQVAGLKKLGVHRIRVRIGCTSPGEFFTDLVETVAEKGVAVDVMWLKQVRDLCESLVPAIAEDLREVTQPNDDSPDGTFQEEVAMGNFLVDVSVSFQDEVSASADFLIPAKEVAEAKVAR